MVIRRCTFLSCMLILYAIVFAANTAQGEFSIPFTAHDICSQREKLRQQREHVMLVVRSYNSEQERPIHDFFLWVAGLLVCFLGAYRGAHATIADAN